MTTTDSSIDYRLAANTQIPLAQALGWWHAHNPNYDFVEALVRTIYEVGPTQWEAPDWVLAQIAVETGNGLSEWAIRYNNFGGIGVNGSTSKNPENHKPSLPIDGSNDWVWMLKDGIFQWVAGLTRTNAVEGAIMMLAHRKAFTDPNYNYWALNRSPRYNLARQNRINNNWPVAVTIDYFGSGRWAADTSYWPKIVAKFRSMRDWRG